MSEKEQKALGIVRRLVDAGFRAVFAGGCVRDRILGIEPKDFDIATDARPEVVLKLFDRTVAVGAKFGVIAVIVGDDSSKSRRSAPMRPISTDAVRRRCALALSKKMPFAATSLSVGCFTIRSPIA
jgi:tRNA nucleotidyltransferase/poly(A) polymerase